MAYMAGFIAVQGARLGVTLVGARYLAKDDMGTWNLLASLPWYFQLAQLGVVNAMNREIPVLLGRRREARADEVAATALWWVTVPTTVALVIAALGAYAAGLLHSWPVLLAAALFIGAQHAHAFWQALNVARGRLGNVVLQQAVLVSGLLGLAALLVPRAGLVGLLGAHAAAYAGAAAVGAWRGGVGPRPWPSVVLTRRLSRLGLPLLLIGVLQTALLSVDRWMIAATIGAAGVGSYTLAVLVATGMQVLPQAYGQLMYAEMGVAYGRTRSHLELRRLMVRQSLRAYAVALATAATAVAVLHVAVPHFLPQYAGGITAASLLAFGLASLSLASGGANYLNVTGRSAHYIAVQMVALAACATASFVAAGRFESITAVAAAVAVIVSLYSVAILVVALRLVRASSRPHTACGGPAAVPALTARTAPTAAASPTGSRSDGRSESPVQVAEGAEQVGALVAGEEPGPGRVADTA